MTASEAAAIVTELIPGASIEIADVPSPDDQLETSFRGVLSIANAQEQLGWQPTYRSLREGVLEYIARYRAFLETPDGRRTELSPEAPTPRP